VKIVYLLIGAKGSGKSYIGLLMKKHLGIEFLNVENFFIEGIKYPDKFDEKENTKVWLKIEKAIDKKLINYKSVSIESVGVFDSFKNFLEKLKLKYSVKLIKIETPLELCFERMLKRPRSGQIKLSIDSVKEMNKMFLKEKYKFDLIVDNKDLSDDTIIEKIKNSSVLNV